MKIDKIGTSETADGHADVAIPVVGRVNVTRVEVQVVRLGATVGGRGPVTAFAAGVLQAAGIDVPTRKIVEKLREVLYICSYPWIKARPYLTVAH